MEGVEATAPRVFLSHSGQDRQRATELAARLAADGFRVWVNETSIAVGRSYAKEIFRGIRTCDAFIVLMSRNSLHSERVRRELGLAVDQNRLVLPVALEPGLLELPDVPEDWLYWLHTTQVMQWHGAEAVAGQVQDSLSSRIGQVEPVTIARLVRRSDEAPAPTLHTITQSPARGPDARPSSKHSGLRRRAFAGPFSARVGVALLASAVIFFPAIWSRFLPGTASIGSNVPSLDQATPSSNPETSGRITGATLIKTISVGSSPWGVVYDPATKLVFVSNFDAGTVSVVDPAYLDQVAVIDVGPHPTALAVDSEARRLYVANWSHGRVTVVDLANYRATPVTVPARDDTIGIAVDRQGHLWVPNAATGTVSIIDGDTLRIADELAVAFGASDGPSPGTASIAIDTERSRAFVSNRLQETISVVATDTRSVTPGLIVPGANHVCVDAGTGNAFIGQIGGEITKLDPDGAPAGVLHVGVAGEIAGLIAAADTLIASAEGDNTVRILDIETGSLVAAVSVGHSPHGIAIDHGNRLYVANRGDGTLSILQLVK